MRRLLLCLLLPTVAGCLVGCLVGCRRDYQVVYSRPALGDSATVDITLAVDTLSDIDPLSDIPVDGPSANDDDGLFDIPDIPTEDEVLNPSEESRIEYDDYMHGR